MLTRIGSRKVSALNHRLSSTFLSKLNSSVQSIPLKEAVRYQKKNIKWSLQDIEFYSNSHANALAQYDVKAGDTIGVWLDDCAEKHITLLAAAKLGVTVADIDVSINNVSQIRDCLKLANAKVLVFAPATETKDNLLLLRKAIPEFAEYDDTYGQHFHSKHFRNLKLFIHTGFDVELGALCYKAVFLPNPTECAVSKFSSTLTDDSAAYFKISAETGTVQAGPLLKHGQLLDEAAWAFAKNFSTQQYFECEN